MRTTKALRPHPCIPVLCALLLAAALSSASETQEGEPISSVPSPLQYRGRLELGDRPVDGLYDFRFRLFDGPRGSIPLDEVDRPAVAVTEGAFLTRLDFARDVSRLEDPYVEIEVRSAEGPGAFTVLEPRQRLAGVGTPCRVSEDVTVNGHMTIDPDDGEPGLVATCCEFLGAENQLSLSSFFSQLAIDGHGFQRFAFGQPGGALLLNAGSGPVGIGVDSADAPLTLPPGPPISGATGGALVVGKLGGPNVAFDGDGIQARNNGSPSTLYLNNEGSDVRIGGKLDIGLSRVVVTEPDEETIVKAYCPSGKQIVSGGCAAAVGNLIVSTTNVEFSFHNCHFEDAATFHKAYALCARID